MIKAEVACQGCPLKDCDKHLGPYVKRGGQIHTVATKYECSAYACNDARTDAVKQLAIHKPRAYTVETDGIRKKIQAVPIGQGFQKFNGVIASIPDGTIYSLPLEKGNVYYHTGQSAFFNKK